MKRQVIVDDTTRVINKAPMTEAEAKRKRPKVIADINAMLESDHLDDFQVMWIAGLMASILEPLARYDEAKGPDYFAALGDRMAQELLLPGDHPLVK